MSVNSHSLEPQIRPVKSFSASIAFINNKKIEDALHFIHK